MPTSIMLRSNKFRMLKNDLFIIEKNNNNTNKKANPAFKQMH